MEADNPFPSETRFPFQTAIDISMGRQRVSGQSVDIGLSSLFIAVEPVPPAGSFLRLVLQTEPGVDLEVSGAVTYARTKASGADEPAGVEVSLALSTDELSADWRKFISKKARHTNVADSSFTTTMVEDNLGYVDHLNAESLLAIYAVDIPRGFFFVKTAINRSEDEIIAITLKTSNPGGTIPSINVHGTITNRYHAGSITGFQLSFIDIDPKLLKSFWDFVCDQTPSRYAPMDFPKEP